MGRRTQECYYCNLIKPTHGWGLCGSCYKGLRTNPDYVPKHKRPEKKCKICGGKYHALDLCVKHYESSDEYKYKQREYYKKPENKKKKAIVNSRHYKKNRDTLLPKMRERYHNLTPEQMESERLRSKQRTANGEYSNYHKNNKNKRNASSKQWRKENPDYSKNWAKENPNSIQKYLRKYEESHVEKRRIQRAKHPEWQVQYPYTISSKISDILNIPHSEIAHKINTKNNECKIRDNFICQICGSKENLKAHHIFYKSKYPKLTLNINNLITLCEYCHNQIHWNKWTRKSFITPRVYFNIIY